MSGIMSAMVQSSAASPPPVLATLADVYSTALLDNWQADAGVHFNGSNVDSWTSQDGLGTVLSWGGGDQPLETVGGMPAIYTKTYGLLFTSTPATYPTGTTGDTKIVVAKPNANEIYAQPYRFNDNFLGTMGPGDGWAYNPGGADTRVSGVNPTISDFDIVIISVASGANPATVIRVNGAAAYTGSISTRSLTTTGNVQVGRNSDLTAQWWYWRQVAQVNRGSTTGEMEEAEGVLAWAWWGNGNILPPSHPYYSAPPYA